MTADKSFKYWRKRILITSVVTYSAFYLCRVNMSIALPGIMNEFGFSKTLMGSILSVMFIAYAFGQFVNGQLGDKLGARKLVTLGILGSGILNLLFGFSSGITVMIIIWGLNGLFQAMGFAPSIKVIANWFPMRLRGRAGGVMGTSYQIGNVYSWVLAGFITGLLGWRWAFWIPAIIFMPLGIHYFVRIRNAPEEAGLPTIEEEANGIKEGKDGRKDHHLGFRHTLKTVLFNTKIWVAALSLFCINIVRYGFIIWAPTYMFEVQGATISTAAYKAIAFPLAGIIGAVFAGWVSDRFFNSRRGPISAIMLALLAIFAWIYPIIPAGEWVLNFVILMLVGFMTFGAHVMVLGAMAMDCGTRKASSSATGFIDGWGYIGTSMTGVGTGFLIDNFGWDAAFNFWILGAIAAAVMMAFLWNFKPKGGKYH